MPFSELENVESPILNLPIKHTPCLITDAKDLKANTRLGRKTSCKCVVGVLSHIVLTVFFLNILSCCQLSYLSFGHIQPDRRLQEYQWNKKQQHNGSDVK